MKLFSDDWQLPAATEKETWKRLSDLSTIPIDFVLCYPWATLIDCCANNYNKARKMLWEIEEAFEESQFAATCCQHIRAYQYSFLFSACGIRDVFWPHTTCLKKFGFNGIRFHAYPLYPVQKPAISFNSDWQREIVVSFKGAYDQRYYISSVRDWIANAQWDSFLSGKSQIEITNEWHFQKDVYQRQVKGEDLNQVEKDNQAKREQDYRDLLSNSVFSLCPSGSGPNSIRIWESIAFGTIPIILADGLLLPWEITGHDYDFGIISIHENKNAVDTLPSLISSLAEDQVFLKRKRDEMKLIWDLYWHNSFARPLLEYISANPPIPRLKKSRKLFSQQLKTNFLRFLSYASNDMVLNQKWPTGMESILSFVVESSTGINYESEYIKQMIIAQVKSNRGISPYLAILQVSSQLLQ
jgi:hypothetical protein